MGRRDRVGDSYPRPDLFEVSDAGHAGPRRLPSEVRDFVPTPGGWAGIVAVTVGLAWVAWQAGSEDAGIGWLVASMVLGYSIALIAWAVIRRELDRREDREAHRSSG